MAKSKAQQIQEEFDAFKAKVVRVAMDLAKEHEWCDVVTEALTCDLGLEVPSVKMRVVIEIDIDPVEGDVDPDDFQSGKDFIESLMADRWGGRERILEAVKTIEPVKQKG